MNFELLPRLLAGSNAAVRSAHGLISQRNWLRSGGRRCGAVRWQGSDEDVSACVLFLSVRLSRECLSAVFVTAVDDQWAMGKGKRIEMVD